MAVKLKRFQPAQCYWGKVSVVGESAKLHVENWPSWSGSVLARDILTAMAIAFPDKGELKVPVPTCSAKDRVILLRSSCSRLR